MKAKAKIILKSLADLPADAFAFVASVPERAMVATKQVFIPSARAASKDNRTTPVGAMSFAPAGGPPLQSPWRRGGLNE
jgi:hypothetical protein